MPEPGSFDALFRRRVRGSHRATSATERECRRRNAALLSPSPPAAPAPAESAPDSLPDTRLFADLFSALAAEGAFEGEAGRRLLLRSLAPSLAGLAPLSLHPLRGSADAAADALIRLLAGAEEAPEALRLSLLLCTARGSLSDALQALPGLAALPPAAFAPGTPLAEAAARCTAALRAEAAAASSVATPTPAERAYMGALPLPPAALPPGDTVAALAAGEEDDSFFVLTSRGLLSRVQVCGRAGAQPRALATLRLWEEAEGAPHAGRCSLSLVQDMLYVRAPRLAPAAFLAVHAPTLRPVGAVRPGGPEQPGDLLSCQENALLPYFAGGSGSGAVACDGELVHMVTREADGGFVAHAHSPQARWARRGSVRLRAPPQQLPPAALEEGCWFAGGTALFCLLPPALASAALGHGALFTLRAYSLLDGQPTAPDAAGAAGVSPLRCFLGHSPRPRPASETWRLASFARWPHMCVPGLPLGVRGTNAAAPSQAPPARAPEPHGGRRVLSCARGWMGPNARPGQLLPLRRYVGGLGAGGRALGGASATHVGLRARARRRRRRFATAAAAAPGGRLAAAQRRAVGGARERGGGGGGWGGGGGCGGG